MMRSPQVNDVVDQMLGEWKRGMLTIWAPGLLLVRPMCGYVFARQPDRFRSRNPDRPANAAIFQ